jgi:hypothetical protein
VAAVGIGITGVGQVQTAATIAANLSYTFTATSTSHKAFVGHGGVYTAGATGTFDNISVRLADPDRSVKANGLIVNGSLTKSAVATGAQLVAYSGFSASNYLEQPYNSALDFGTGDFCVMWWENNPSTTTQAYRFSRGTPGPASSTDLGFYVGSDYLYRVVVLGASTSSGVTQTASGWVQMAMVRVSGVLQLYINGTLAYSVANTANLTNTLARLRVGTDVNLAWSGVPIALFRASATAPSADQIAKIYRDELALFQPNAKCVIDGTSAAVTALAYDEDTDVLHAGTSWGRSAFKGLTRIESAATSVGAVTSIAAGMGAHITAGASSGRFYQPALLLRDEIKRRTEARKALGQVPVFFDFDAIAAQAAFVLPKGYSAVACYVAGVLKRNGVTKDWTKSDDGFQETINFGVAPGAATWVSIMATRK